MKRLRIRLQLISFVILIISILYLIFYLRYNEIDYKYNDDVFNDFLIIKNIYVYEDKSVFEFNGNIIGTYYASISLDSFNIGDTVKVNGNISIPKNNTIFNMFNYKKYLLSKRIYYTLSIDEIVLVKENSNIINKIKNYIILRCNKIDYKGYIYSFIIGTSKYIDNEIYSIYKENNITHLFSVSGMHINILVLIFYKIFKKKNKINFVFLCLFLFIELFILSFTPSSLRSVLFFILLYLKKKYRINIDNKNILYIVFSLLIFINPYYIYNTGFILSFAVSFIYLFSSKYIKINSSFISCLLAFLSSFIIIIKSNFSINIIGFLNNIILIPYVSLIYIISLIVFIIPKFIFIFKILIDVLEKISFVSNKLLNLTIYFSSISLIEIIVYYLLLLVLIKYKKKIFYVIFIIYVILLYNKNKFDNNLYVYYIDVGQGDSILIKNSKTSILIDTGNSSEYYDLSDDLINFFYSVGIKEIDYLIITHGDNDHIGNASNLINDFDVNNIIFNCGDINENEEEFIYNLNKTIKYYSCINELNVDNISMFFLNTGLYDNENDNSIVIYMYYNGFKFLFMGDASKEREIDILEKYDLRNMDFLKVGHHGSSTSSSDQFINSINPKYSIISVGKNNRYGHPKNSVLNILEEQNSKIYRTDEDGSIEIKIKSDGYSIETCEP